MASSEVTEYLALIGSKGGSSGRGASKRRSRKHYQAAAKARWSKQAIDKRKAIADTDTHDL